MSGAGSGWHAPLRRERFEMLARQVHHALVRQIAGRREQQIRRRIDRAIVTPNHLAVETLHRFARAQNRLAQRMILPEIRREDLVDQIIRTVRLHLELFEDHAFFLVDILVAEHAVQHQVGQNIHGERQVLVQHLRVEAHQFLGGEGVQIAADGVHRARDLLGGPVGGALEQHVLDEVREAVLLLRFRGAIRCRSICPPRRNGHGA